MGCTVCRYDSQFPLYKGWVESACLLSCEIGAADVKLLIYCSRVTGPSPFSAEDLGLGVLQKAENLPRSLCGAGTFCLETSTKAH
jgi:hypothetical protein